VLIGPAREFDPITEPITNTDWMIKGLTSVAEALEPAVPETLFGPLTKSAAQSPKKRRNCCSPTPPREVFMGIIMSNSHAPHDALNDFQNREGCRGGASWIRINAGAPEGLFFRTKSAGSRELSRRLPPVRFKMSPGGLLNRIWRLAEKGIKTEIEIFADKQHYKRKKPVQQRI
jgi:hypothetical protein